MAETHNYTVQDVRELFEITVIDTFAVSDEGQAHLNRIAKAITNESLEKRKESSKLTHAKTAFDKEVSKVASMSPDKLPALLAGKDAWIKRHIDRKYGTDEE